MENEQIDLEFNEQPQTHGKRVYVYFGLVSMIMLAVFLGKARWQENIPVSQISVEGNTVLTKEDVYRLMKLPPRVPMFEVDLMELQKNIRTNTFVKNVVVQRDAPSMLRVIIEERVPAALLVANELYYIDDEGVVLPYTVSSETYDIPVISGVDSSTQIKVGKRLFNQDLREALDIITTAKLTSDKIFHAISEIRLRKGHDKILYTFETDIPIIFGKGDIVNKIVKLDAFWQQYIHNNDAQGINYIDVRFDDQVVVSRKKS